jgi:hypothetical protein
MWRMVFVNGEFSTDLIEEGCRNVISISDISAKVILMRVIVYESGLVLEIMYESGGRVILS